MRIFLFSKFENGILNCFEGNVDTDAFTNIETYRCADFLVGYYFMHSETCTALTSKKNFFDPC